MRIAALLLCGFLAGIAPAKAQSVDDTITALSRADQALNAATDSRSQRRALGLAIRAYERAIRQLGRDISDVAAQVRSRTRALEQDQAEVRSLMGGLIRLGQISAPLAVAESDAPLDALRAMVLLEGAAATANTRASALLAERAALQDLQTDQSDLLRRMESARTRLSEMRATLIARAEQDTTRVDGTPDISADTATLTALAIALESALPGDSAAANLRARLSAPVEGTIARAFMAADAAGLQRPGLAVSAAPGSVVTAPAEASVRFVGELDGYGQVVILEPQQDVLLVLAGLGTITVRTSETLQPGMPLGFMPGSPVHKEFSSQELAKGGLVPAKTLYMELRHNQAPVDPEPWFDDLR